MEEDLSDRYISKPKKKEDKKEKTCLCCGYAFLSIGPQNRMCRRCKDHAGDYAGEGSSGRQLGARDY